eukprot:1988834-Pyramimonas_sp.AAC.1
MGVSSSISPALCACTLPRGLHASLVLDFPPRRPRSEVAVAPWHTSTTRMPAEGRGGGGAVRRFGPNLH